jgi:hypothetical protein
MLWYHVKKHDIHENKREKNLKCNCIDYGKNITNEKSYLLMRWIHLYIGTTKYQLLTISLTLSCN